MSVILHTYIASLLIHIHVLDNHIRGQREKEREGESEWFHVQMYLEEKGQFLNKLKFRQICSHVSLGMYKIKQNGGFYISTFCQIANWQSYFLNIVIPYKTIYRRLAIFQKIRQY